MTRLLSLSVLASLSTALLGGTALADPVFNRIAAFPVNANLPADADQKTPTSAEIITASADGMMLAYSDSPAKRVGFIDITDPAAPKPAGVALLDGEPTSVSFHGGRVFVAINTSESKVKPSGVLAVVDPSTKAVTQTCDVGGQPDSLAVAPDGSFVAIAVENERDEDLNDGEIPQMPAGHLAIFALKDGLPVCDSKIISAVTGLAAVAGDDPEPEFVDINAAGEIALTLQENNHIVVVNGRDGKVTGHFPAGAVTISGTDVKRDGALTFAGEKKDVAREPDAVQWLDNDRFVVANEGDYKGGSRGFTIFSKTGEVLFDSGVDLEHRIAAIGHYPERRASSKGVEPEGVEVKKFGDATYIFVLSERSSVIAVYKDTGAAPTFVQLLPSGLAPEGAVAIPERNLLVVSNEVDLVKDDGVRSHVTIYRLGDGPMAYPTIVSAPGEDGKPVGWGALSGLAADPEKAGTLYAVNDSFYAMQPTIFTIDATKQPAVITGALPVKRSGQPAQLLDLEGVVADGEGGFWVASEGRADAMVPHGILHVTAKGEIDKTIGLPEELAHTEKRFGFEGITKVGSGDAMTLWMAVQREWSDDAKGMVKLVAYNPKSEEWGAVRYPLDKGEAGWVGLSEITAHGDHVYLIERDNRIGAAAAIKKIYRVALSEMKPAKLGGDLPVVKKELVRDLLPEMQKTGGYVLEKVEGFTIDKAGTGYVVTDNDGVNDSNGETQFWSIGKVN